jgi:hypothetical protein
VTLLPEVKQFLSAPGLMIHALPASYGQTSLDDSIELIKEINKNSKSKIELQTFNGTHHFHMIQPEKTATRIHEFLDKLKVAPSTKL